MFNLSGVFGNIAESVGRIDISAALEKAAQDAQKNASTNGTLGGFMKGISSPAAKGMVDKLAYIAILQGAIKKAAQSNQFNLETQINDLWLALSSLRASNAARERLQQQVEAQKEVLDKMTQMLKQMDNLSKSAIHNLR